MPLFLLLAALALPLLEIAVFILVGEEIGAFATIGLIILSAVAGLLIIRWQGVSILMETQRSLGQNGIPVAPAIHGAFLAIAGFLLLIPGFITDAVAFALLIPPVRLALGRTILERIRRSKRFSVHVSGGPPFGQGREGFRAGPSTGPVIEGEVIEDLTPADDDPPNSRIPGATGSDQSPWRR
ncbi:UPF0716 protein FxsA [Rhodoligotrophos appendicifer]|uniref:FxsA family protein n=1 Tax=Rhodoligotrophos appendicifer TaxID=987056 RepID=UPI00117D7831|nr:FxsA family protein [Rhodoligotrophos appendicifer]